MEPTDVKGFGRGEPVQKGSATTFRVSAAEKEEIRDVAERLGLSVCGYLLGLHRIARESWPLKTQLHLQDRVLTSPFEPEA